MSDNELNLSGWIERRKSDVGPYSDIIIKGVREYESRIEQLEAKLAKAVEALGDLADCVDDGCYCSEMQMATAMDKARTTLTELTGDTQ